MRIITIILSIYIIALAFIPCTDGHEIGSNHTTESTAGHENHTDDTCSPFCACSCCGILIFNFSQNVAFTPHVAIPLITSSVPMYKSVLNSFFYGTIWQPPQIV